MDLKQHIDSLKKEEFLNEMSIKVSDILMKCAISLLTIFVEIFILAVGRNCRVSLETHSPPRFEASEPTFRHQRYDAHFWILD